MRLFRTLFLLATLTAAGRAHAQYVAEDSASKQAVPDAPRTPARPSQPRSAPRVPFADRLSYGGNFGLSFSTANTYIETSPLVLVNLTPHLQVGPGVTYIYQSVNYAGYKYSTSIYGGRLVARYLFLQNFFAQAQVEALSLEAFNQEFHGRYTIVSPLVGGGYRVPLGGNGGVYITALYNLNYNTNLSPYSSPFVFQIGFMLGGGGFSY